MTGELRQTSAPTVLIVDDNPVNLQVMLQTLQGRGYRLLVAKSGEQALKVAREAAPHLILLDIMMPGIDGMETCKRLKIDPTTSGIPVIFLSALSESNDKVRGLELGAVDYITKPIQPDEVAARVTTHLTINRLTEELRISRDGLDRELANVAEMQRLLLPPELPKVHGVKMAAFYNTSRHAGGDYYDLRPLPHGRIGLMIADVAGHGATAAVIMAMMRSAYHCFPRVPMGPSSVLRYINQHFEYLWGRSLFITALNVTIDPQQKRMQLAVAGHPLPILCRDGQTRQLTATRVIPLMIDRLDSIPESEFALESGDRLLFFTDGIVERFSPLRELFGEKRLADALADCCQLSPEEALESLHAHINEFAGHVQADDDQTLIVVDIA